MLSFFRMIANLTVIVLTLIETTIGTPITGSNFKIDVPASVFETGDNMYTVIWTTNKRGTGSITYTYEDKEYTVYDQAGGNIKCMDTIHSVRVPKEHLDNNEYTYSSQYVPFKGGYSAVKGKTVTSGPIEFKGYNGQDSVNALVLSDIHENVKPAVKAASYFTVTPDIVILNGDIVSTIEKKEKFTYILEYANIFSGGSIPVVYVRGNHEPRGEYASEMMQYFKTETGNLYFTFNYGPVWALVLDGGEDKADDHKEYSGLVDFSTYIAEETKWLENLDPDNGNASWRMAITHKPRFENEYGNDWTEALENVGTDICISGHNHTLNLNYMEGSTDFVRLVTGGKNDSDGTYIATMMTFSPDNVGILSVDNKGETRGERTIEKQPLAQ